MNEYKFLAFIYPYKQAIFVPVFGGIIMAYFMFFRNDLIFQYFSIFFALTFIYVISFWIITIRYVKILTDSETISIYYWGRLKYKAKISDLQYILAYDIEEEGYRGEIKFIFNDKQFTFFAGENRGLLKTSNNTYTKLLKDSVSKYQLTKEFESSNFWGKSTYKYINPTNDLTSINKSSYNKKER